MVHDVTTAACRKRKKRIGRHDGAGVVNMAQIIDRRVILSLIKSHGPNNDPMEFDTGIAESI
jgi:hypothetical protein